MFTTDTAADRGIPAVARRPYTTPCLERLVVDRRTGSGGAGSVDTGEDLKGAS